MAKIIFCMQGYCSNGTNQSPNLGWFNMDTYYTPYIYYRLRQTIFFSLGLNLILYSTIHPAYHEYRVAANIPAGKAAYPFGIIQYKVLEQFDALPGLYGYLDFDTEAVYLETAFAPWGVRSLPRIGARTKGHAFDWQNLNYLVSPDTGRPQREQSLMASYLMGDFFAGVAYLSWLARLGAGGEVARLTPGKENSPWQTANPAWFYFYTLSGYYRQYPYLPDFPLGDSFLLGYTVYNLQQKESPGEALPLARQFQEMNLTFKIAFFIPAALVKLEQRLAVTSFAAPGQLVDIPRSFSMGGPEIAYGRLSGFAFSEYRVPAFGLTNLDILLPLAAGFHLWLTGDLLFTDRPFAGRRLHGGTGSGLYYVLPDAAAKETTLRRAIFLRLDRGHTAQRRAEIDRWQLFLGFSGFRF